MRSHKRIQTCRPLRSQCPSVLAEQTIYNIDRFLTLPQDLVYIDIALVPRKTCRKRGGEACVQRRGDREVEVEWDSRRRGRRREGGKVCGKEMGEDKLGEREGFVVAFL